MKPTNEFYTQNDAKQDRLRKAFEQMESMGKVGRITQPPNPERTECLKFKIHNEEK